MNFKFKNKKITGILVVLPENEVRFEDEVNNYNFPPEKSLRLKKVMGYKKHRIVSEGTCVSDLCLYGLNYLINSGLLKKAEIEAILLITQTPDYIMPPTSNLIQGKLGLHYDVICMDINQGCCGYIIGLIQSFMLLDTGTVKKVVLLNADVLSRKTSAKDRNSYPLIGDAAAITIIENAPEENIIYANLKMDGSRGDALLIPAGGMRIPHSPGTSELKDAGDGNMRSMEHLIMDGSGVFNFVQTEIPQMIEELMSLSGFGKDTVDHFVFHQPNKFMLQKLAEKLKIPYEKMYDNIVENFGNSSGSTIPVNLAFNLSAGLLRNSSMLCLAGFGSGLAWASMLIRTGGLAFCKIIEYAPVIP